MTDGFAELRRERSRDYQPATENAVIRGRLDMLATDAATALGTRLDLGIKAGDGGYLGVMDDESRYGPHYLSELMMAFGYTEAGIVGGEEPPPDAQVVFYGSPEQHVLF
jgi:hypothetical protein